jgi:integration host factor subunit beta
MLDKNTFVKSDIVKDLQGHFQAIPNNNVEKIVESIFKYLGNALAEGRNIEIRGLGTFKIKRMPARNARNPKTGESIMIEEKNKLKWRSSKLLNFRINKKENIEK